MPRLEWSRRRSRVVGDDSQLRRWGLGLAVRGGKAAKRKAVVAVARKLAILLHVLWKREVDFDPFYGSKDPKPPVEAAPVSGSASVPAG